MDSCLLGAFQCSPISSSVTIRDNIVFCCKSLITLWRSSLISVISFKVDTRSQIVLYKLLVTMLQIVSIVPNNYYYNLLKCCRIKVLRTLNYSTIITKFQMKISTCIYKILTKSRHSNSTFKCVHKQHNLL